MQDSETDVKKTRENIEDNMNWDIRGRRNTIRKASKSKSIKKKKETKLDEEQKAYTENPINDTGEKMGTEFD